MTSLYRDSVDEHSGGPETRAAVRLPVGREGLFDPPDQLRLLQQLAPVCRLLLPNGREGWLVTRFEEARTVLADSRFSSKNRGAANPVSDVPDEVIKETTTPGLFVGMDPPEHTRYRHLLAGYFTLHRTRFLESLVDKAISQVLAGLVGRPGADLVSDFAAPVSHLIMCEILGLPMAGRDTFHELVQTMVQIDGEQDEVLRAFSEVNVSLRTAIEERSAVPDAGVLSDLIHRPKSGDRLSLEELQGVAFLLLVAGYDTTSSMISMGTLALLSEQTQLAVLRSEPGLMGNAVEELLRYLTVNQFGFVRVATEDVTVGGVAIAAGDPVIVSAFAGNRDGRRFPEPDRLDVRRTGIQHLTFGHGIHQCIGAHVARTAIRSAFSQLFATFPSLRLAVDVSELELRGDMPMYAPARLPVSW